MTGKELLEKLSSLSEEDLTKEVLIDLFMEYSEVSGVIIDTDSIVIRT